MLRLVASWRTNEVLPQDIIQLLDYNPTLMGAWLSGYDLATIADCGTIASIIKLIERKKENLILQMAKSFSHSENALEVTEELLSAFMQGIHKIITKNQTKCIE